MASENARKDDSEPQGDTGVKRRGLLRVGTLLGTVTGASAIFAVSATSAQAAPDDLYVPIAEKGAPAGVAPLDANAKILPAQFPDGIKDGRTICRGFSRADVVEALNAAEAKGRGAVAHFPAGVYDVGTTLSLAGYSCQLRGEGAAGTRANPTGTVFYASAQTGPVLNFTGCIIPTDIFTGRIRHSDFMVRGSGVADPTKSNAGIRLKTMSSATFADIAIRDTGCPCLEFYRTPATPFT